MKTTPHRPSSRCSLALLLGVLLAAPIAQAGWPLELSPQGMPSLAPMLEKVTPAVVNIATSSRVNAPNHPLFRDPLFRRFFAVPESSPEQRRPNSLGSGVVIDAKAGIILTNNHVIEKADQVSVTLRDGRTVSAKLVGRDPDTDVAVIQVQLDQLQALPLGDSDQLRVGDFVVAIGNPFGLGQTVTSGIVSALGRKGLGIEGYEDFIQTDASINPGNSGGALVNLKGELVGINTAILAPSGGNVGIGFAIPVNMARQVMAQLVSFGKVRRGMLGVQSQDLTPKLAETLGVKATQGAVVTAVVDDSAAQRAGLQPGDVIVEVNGHPILGTAQLRNTVGLLRVGEVVRVKALRENRALEITITLAEPERSRINGSKISSSLGGAVLELQPGTGKKNAIILVVESDPDGNAWRIGLRPGDQIVAVNRREVSSFQEMAKAVGKERHKLLLTVRRDDDEFTILVR